MSNFGRNMKITIDEAHRTLTRSIFVDALGCSLKSPKPDMELYTFADGCLMGANYVKAGDALPATELKKAPWLEFRVEDPEVAGAKLAKLGLQPFEYVDKTHRYYCPPGGPVFRLAPLD